MNFLLTLKLAGVTSLAVRGQQVRWGLGMIQMCLCSGDPVDPGKRLCCHVVTGSSWLSFCVESPDLNAALIEKIRRKTVTCVQKSCSIVFLDTRQLERETTLDGLLVHRQSRVHRFLNE